MLHNYIKTALRGLRANKTHSFVNIAGLSAGMAVTILIGLWIWDEVSFDKSNSHYDRIAQVLGNATMNGSVNTFPTQPVPEADVLRQDFGSDFKYVDFSRDFATDSSAFIINETAAKFMGLTNPVGEIIRWDDHPMPIIGVIKDVIAESPYEPVRPTLYHMRTSTGSFDFFKLNPAIGTREALAKIQEVYKAYSPLQPFDYKFADEEYGKKFGDEQRTGKLATAFAILAVFISCLGLFAMAAFTAEQRVKEIGVRKVLGASVFNLWGLLSKEFVTLVILSLLLATPVAWYAMNHWLQNYPYHASLPWWIFAAAAAGALIITLATISFQIIRAALTNPINSLRTE